MQVQDPLSPLSMPTSELPLPLRRRTLGLLILVILAPSLGTLAALWWWPGSCGSAIYGLCKLVLYGVPTVVAWQTITRAQFVRGLRAGVRPAAILWGIGSGAVIGTVILVGWFGFVWIPREEVSTARRRLVGDLLGAAARSPISCWSMELGDGDLAERGQCPPGRICVPLVCRLATQAVGPLDRAGNPVLRFNLHGASRPGTHGLFPCSADDSVLPGRVRGRITLVMALAAT